MAPRNVLVITRSLRVNPRLTDKEVKDAEFDVLRKGMQQYRKKAVAIASVPASPYAKGVDTGWLIKSIKINMLEPGLTPKGFSLRATLYADERMTQRPNTSGTRRGYAYFQEVGTGLHGPEHRWIVPRSAKRLSWTMQTGRKMISRKHKYQWQNFGPEKFYHGSSAARRATGKGVTLWRSKVGFERTSKGRGKQRRWTEITTWRLFADRVSGSKPKHFMRDAGRDKQIREDMKTELAQRIAKILAKQETATAKATG